VARKNERKEPAEIYRNMSAIRSKENRTEAALRKSLFALGLRYRKYGAGLIGRPDIVFSRERLAIFIDGDYWHGRLLREGGEKAANAYFSRDKNNYWVPKLQRRIVRDDYVTRSLEELGWTVLRFWESEVKKHLLQVRDVIAGEVARRRGTTTVSRGS
jgi:DNA mismatch endonuclease (patch repair protein)